jgi:FkbM family methyltransferase
MIAYRMRQQWARGAKLLRILATPDYRQALRRGVAAAVEHEHLRLPIEPRTVLDVGANRGQFALVAAHRWPNARLICFEPLPSAAGLLRSVLASTPQAEIHNVALANEPGEVKMHVSKADDSSSLLSISARQSQTFPGTEEVGLISVQAARLDDELDVAALSRPVLLKIDVQGGELGVLHGGERSLQHVDAVLVECSFVEFYDGQPLAHEVLDFLGKKGFRLTGAGTPTTDAQGSVVQIDMLFTHDAD